MQNFGRENFDDSTFIRQISSDFSTVKVLRYTVLGRDYETIRLEVIENHVSHGKTCTYLKFKPCELSGL